MKYLNKIVQFVFGVSSKEFSGFRWLVFTTLICVAGVLLADKLTKRPYQNYPKDARKLDSLLKLMEPFLPVENNTEKVILFPFNPNTISKDSMQQLGIPPLLAQRIHNYRLAGGHFTIAQDVKRIYGFSDSLYQRLDPFIRIPAVDKRSKPNNTQYRATNETIPNYKKVIALAPFDINKADTTTLKQIKGIGSTLSKRIIAYRNKLGGFVNLNQLYEVYYLDSMVVQKLLNNSFISHEFTPSTLKINEATQQQLASHPYISYQQAKLIVAYRKQHGSFKYTDDLMDVYSIAPQWVKKIAPYLSF